MRADGGVRHDSARRLGSSLFAELSRIEPDQRDLVEQGSVANDLRHRIHREGELLGTATRQVLRYDHLSGALAVGEDEAIPFPRTSQFLILPRDGDDPRERQPEPEAERTQQYGPSLLAHRVSRRPWTNSPTSSGKRPQRSRILLPAETVCQGRAGNGRAPLPARPDAVRA